MRPNELVQYDQYKKRTDSRIAEAKALLENSGYSVLQWQTGEPEVNRPILVKYKDDDKYEVMSKSNSIYDIAYGLMKNQIEKWAYLPEGGNK